MNSYTSFDEWADERREERRNGILAHPCFIRGVIYERERILKLLKAQPTALEFYEPYVATDKLIEAINGGKDE